MKSRLVIFIILMQQIAFMAFGQSISTTSDSAALDKFETTLLNIRPMVLMKNDLLVRMNFDFPGYKRTLNTSTGSMEKLPDNVVINAMLINAYVDYGLSSKLTVFARLPLSDIHSYSPKGVVSEKGPGDTGLGADYLLIKNKSGNNTLTGELTAFFPTGKNISNSGLLLPVQGKFALKGSLTGMHRTRNSAMIYSAYYEFRPAHPADLKTGDTFGITSLRQNYYSTRYGNFGIEYGGYVFIKTDDKNNDVKLSHTGDYEVTAFAGGWFEYGRNLFLHFGIPYTVYQNRSPFTKYDVLFQLDYRFEF